MEKSINFIIGTKAELIKMAPVMLEADRQKLRYNFIMTGQHTKTGHELIKIFNLREPDYWITHRNEDLKTPIQALCWAFKCIVKSVFSGRFRKDDIIICHGDTESTFIACVISLLTRAKLIHIEGGLRSFDIKDPFPEEIIRRLTDKFSYYIFCTSEWSVDNLKREHSKAGIFNIKANTVEDAVKICLKPARVSLPVQDKYAVVMLHRKETLYNDEQLKKGIWAVERIAEDLPILFILSKNSEHILKKKGYWNRLIDNKNIKMLDYFNYIDFVQILSKAEFVAADSGGLQEETYALNKPYLILRNKTERREGLNQTAFISELKPEKINEFLNNYKTYKREDLKFASYPSFKIVEELLCL